jgi:glycosyltransferase involved in cell wall biosynthesis
MSKYSIILPVRNGGTHVKYCISSILNQTFASFDLVVLDNNSTDDTASWIQSLADNRVKLYPSDRSLSMEENWGRIVSVPKNEYMTIIGHDDLLDNHYLQLMDQLVTDNPTCTLYQAHFRFIDGEGKLISSCQPMKRLYQPAEFLEAILKGSLDTMGTGYMMRSADYERLGGIPPYPNLLFADHALWLSLSIPGGLAVAATECFSFRVHQSTSRTTNIASYIKAFYLFLEFLGTIGKSSAGAREVIEKQAPGFISFYCRSFAHRLVKTPLSKRDNVTVAALLEKSKHYADLLAPGNDFDPRSKTDVRISEVVDSNRFLAKLYLGLRSIYKKPLSR